MNKSVPVIEELQNTVFKNFNIPREDILKLKVYHYIKYDYFFKSINNKNILFDRVIDWDDKYENFLFKAKINVNGQNISFEKEAGWVYAKCFTIEEESYAMWLNRNEDYIKYETTVEDIFYSIFKLCANIINNRKFIFRIGIVEYKTKSEIQSFYKEKFQVQSNLINIGNELFDSILIKRVEYKYEKELRAVLFFENINLENLNPIELKYRTFPLKVNSIVFHPKISQSIFEERKKNLIKIGFKNIKKSDILDNNYLRMTIKNKTFNK